MLPLFQKPKGEHHFWGKKWALGERIFVKGEHLEGNYKFIEFYGMPTPYASLRPAARQKNEKWGPKMARNGLSYYEIVKIYSIFKKI